MAEATIEKNAPKKTETTVTEKVDVAPVAPVAPVATTVTPVVVVTPESAEEKVLTGEQVCELVRNYVRDNKEVGSLVFYQKQNPDYLNAVEKAAQDGGAKLKEFLAQDPPRMYEPGFRPYVVLRMTKGCYEVQPLSHGSVPDPTVKFRIDRDSLDRYARALTKSGKERWLSVAGVLLEVIDPTRPK